MTREQALAIVEAASIHGLCLGNHDDWTDYVKARTVLGDPIDLRPVHVSSNLVPISNLYPWEREVLLPVVRPLLVQWVKQNVEEDGGGSR